jgi:hypothetical protein
MLRPSLLLLPVLFLFVVPLQAKKDKAPKYYLHVQVLRASYECTNCDYHGGLSLSMPGGVDGVGIGYNPFDPDDYYAGYGRAVFLLDANKTQRFWFLYSGCLAPLPLSNTASLAARWKKPGYTIEMLVPPYSPKKPVNYAAKHMIKCQLDVSSRGPIPITRPSATGLHTPQYGDFR